MDTKYARTCLNCGKRFTCERYSYYPCEEHKTDSEWAAVKRAVIDALMKGEANE